ncbi:exosortase Y-associated Wzy-like protein [Mucilaginibacter sp. Mucisp86]|uniref:exosortase Y-associated Wzy-like protein n=1 Tax=Mucilaginibacter sp. Mucisp86 TaxID=3243060 RepID=UPI0039B5DCF2
MQQSKSIERYIVLFIPWLLALACKSDSVLSYFVAWGGSFFIFLITLTGWVRPIPNDRPIAEQLMRPLFIIQIIFAGYMCSTSIFYFMNTLGYENFKHVFIHTLNDKDTLGLIAQCQRYYCLGHASFVMGVLIFMNYPVVKKYHIETEKLANLLMVSAIISFPLSLVFLKVPGLSQFYYQFSSLSFIAGTLALAFAIPLKKAGNTLICFLLYAFNFYQALTSGFKEPIIISILVLGIFLYPTYKKLVTITFIPAIFLLFTVLPTYNHIYRANAWNGDTNSDQASQLALDAALNVDDEDVKETNWDFLVYRLSEIDMFTRFVQSTPKNVDFYGLDLVKQSAIALVPRILWPSKPITEDLIMQRVYDAGVVNRNSSVSAKPAYIVDAYLSGGDLGIFIFLFGYGAIAQLIAVKAEKLFGGYILGTALIFSGLFQIMWRGISFEFLFNTVFWSYISMLLIHRILVNSKILKEV